MIHIDKTRMNTVRYTTRDFDGWKSYLVNYIKRNYPNTVQDFTEASWNSLVINLISLLGESSSFYLDYAFNEAFPLTALEYDTVLAHAQERGYKPQFGYAAYGKVACYATIPASVTGLSPDLDYAPVLKKGSLLSTIDGKNFIVANDVYFDDEPEVRVGQVNATTGTPVTYILKKYADVISGTIKYIESTIGDYEQFLEIEVEDDNIVEIISVYDADGFQYYEVDNLAQNIIFQEIPYDGNEVQSILKPVTVSKRFTVDYRTTAATIKFGGGSDELGTDYVNEPQSVVLEFYGRNYISSVNLDPTKLVSNDKFGVAPANTTLRITYRANSADMINAAVGTLNTVDYADLFFKDRLNLNPDLVTSVLNTFSVYNEEIINGDLINDTAEEIKNRILASFSAQKRAVSLQDYRAVVYSMPARFGGIRRCNITPVSGNDLKTELNIYVIGQDSEGKLTPVNFVVKGNLSTWLEQFKMGSDTINILDLKVVNLGIDFEILVERGFDRYNVLTQSISALADYYSKLGEGGEPFNIAAIYTTLKDVNGVIDVTKVNIKQKRGGLYSDLGFDLKANFSQDGRYIKCPKNVIFEVKYPLQDIQGAVR